MAVPVSHAAAATPSPSSAASSHPHIRTTNASVGKQIAAAPLGLQDAIAKALAGRPLASHGRKSYPRPEPLSASYDTNRVNFSTGSATFSIGLPAIGRGSGVGSVSNQGETVPADLEHLTQGAKYGTATLSESFAPATNGTGIEQSFAIAKKPSGAGRLVVSVPVVGAVVEGTGSQLTVVPTNGDRKHVAEATYSGLKVIDATGAVVPATMAAAGGGSAIAITVNDTGATYPLTIDPSWGWLTDIAVSGSTPVASFALSGDTAVLGVPSQQQALIFMVESSGWWLQSTYITPNNYDPDFGAGVAISGSTIVVGGDGVDHVFTGGGQNWYETDDIGTGFSGTGYDGAVVAAAPGALALGYTSTSICGGALETPDQIRIFTPDATSVGIWDLTDTLSVAAATSCTLTATQPLVFSGTTLALGDSSATEDSNPASGSVQVFTVAAPDTWSGPTTLTLDDTGYSGGAAAGSSFGYSLALSPSGDNLLVGAPTSGVAYDFANTGANTWGTGALLANPDATATNFGTSVAFTVASGADYAFVTADETSTSGGSFIDVYQLSGSTWSYSMQDVVGVSGLDPTAGFVAASGALLLSSNEDTSGNADFIPWGSLVAASPVDPLTNAELFGGGSPSEHCQCVNASAGTTKAGSTNTGSVPVAHYSGDPVDGATGDFTDSATDLTLPGAGVPLTFTRTYDAQSAQQEQTNGSYAGTIGYGWSDNLEMSLQYAWWSTDNATITEENGAQVTFAPYYGSGTGPSWCNGLTTDYCPTEPRVDATLNQNGDGSWTFVRDVSSPETFEFDSSGILISITDAGGDSLTLSSYSPSGGQTPCPSGDSCKAWTSSASGRELVLATNNSTDQLTKVFDANSDLAATFSYSGSGCTSWSGSQTPDLCSVTDPGGIVSTYTYDSANASADFDYDMLTATPAGASGQTTNTYNANGQVSSQIDPAGAVTDYAYAGTPESSMGGTTTITTYPDGTGSGEPTDVTVDSYVNDALVEEQQDFSTGGTPEQATTTITRDPNTFESTATTAPNGGITTNTYDGNGNLVTSTDALGNETLYAYTADNQIWCTVKPAEVANGVTCPSTEPTSPPAPGASDPWPGAAITFYNTADEVTATTDPLGNTTTYSYTSGVSGVPNNLLYCSVDPVSYQASVTCPAYGASHVTGTTTETYDSHGDKTAQTNATGATTTYSYSYGSTHPGLVSSLTDPDGNVTSYTYNGAGEPTDVTTSFGSYSSTTLKAYDTEGRLYCEVDPIEAAASVTCPSSPPSASSPPAHLTSTFYDADGRVIQSTNALGGTNQTAYDGVGLVYCTVTPLNYAGGTRCPSSEPTTQPTPGSDPYSGATITGYNGLGLPIQVTNALGGIETSTYNAYGQLASTTTESNNSTADPAVTTTYTYDADDRVINKTVGSALSTTLAYDPNGDVYCTDSAATNPTYPQCPTWSTSWVATPPNPSTLYWSGGASMMPTSSAYANGVTTDFYDDNGQLVQSSTPDVATTIDVLNGDGNPYCTSDPTNVAAYLSAHSGATYPYNCPSTAPTTQPTSGSNPGYQTTIYDAAGNVLSQSNANADITTHTYDAAGDVLSTTDPDGKVTTDCYYYEDASGQCAHGAPGGGGAASALYSTLTPATSADPSSELTTFTHGPSGQTVTKVTPAGTDTFTYDGAGDELTSTYSSVASGYSTPATVTNTYNSDTTLATMADASGTTTYSYDADGDQTSQALVAGSGTGLANQTTSYSYFTTGVLAGITYPAYGSYSSPAVSYTYDATANMVSSTDWLGNKITYAHDDNGPEGNEVGQDNNVSSGAPDGTSNTSVAYSAGGVDLGTTATTCVTGTSGTVGVSSPDNVNPDGQVTGISLTNGSCGATATTSGESYTYTTAGQVASENSNAFSYDAAGNLTQMTQPAGSSVDTYTQAFDNAGEVTSQTPVSGSGGSTTAFAYDTLGDQTSASGGISSSASYNAAGQMASQSSGTSTTTYLYAGDGLETGAATTTGSSTVTAQLTWERAGDLQGSGYPEVISDGTNDYIFGPNGTPSEEIALSTSTPTYLAYDNANDTWTATTQSGTLAGFWGYDAYGSVASGAPVSGYGYDGQYTDTATGFTDDRARFYDPSTGTFETRDPAFEQTDTAYTYAGDDPVNESDPTGLSWWNPTTWTAKTWENIGSVAAVTAAFVPGLDVVAGAVAITAGSIAAGENASQGNWVSAGLDVAGVGLSAFGVGEAISADRSLGAAANAEKEYGYLAPWYASDAADAAARAARLSRWGAGLGAASFALGNFLDFPSAGALNLCG